MLYKIPMEEKFIMSQLADVEHKDVYKISGQNETFSQMNLFSDFNLQAGIG